MKLRAVHQFHAGSAAGDGVTNGMLLTRALLRELGLESEIYVAHVAPELRGDLLPHVSHPGPTARPDELMIVHYSMGHDAHAWIDSIGCPKVLAYHNITPSHLLADETMRHYAQVGRQQLAVWGAAQCAGHGRPFLGAMADSSFNAEELRQLGFGRGDEPLEVLPLLVDVEGRTTSSAGAPHEHPIDGGTPQPAQVLFVGRVIEHKRQHELVALLPHLRRRIARGVHLTLVGGGERHYISALRALAAELGVSDALTIAGKVPDLALAEHYRRADLFICLSEHEGYCMPLVEAAIHGVPVLAYDCGAVAETLGEGGMVLRTREPDMVAAAAALLLDAPDVRRKVLDGQSANLARLSRAALRQRLAGFIEGVRLVLPRVQVGGWRPTPRRVDYRLEGPFTSSYSLALVNRELGLALSRRGERVELRSMEGAHGDFDPDPGFLQARPDVGAIAARPAAPGTKAAPAEVVLRNMYPPRPDGIRSLGLRGLACYAWEETGFPREYVQSINRSLDLVTVTSTHVQRILQDSGVHVPVAVVGNGTDHLERAGEPVDLAVAEAVLGGRATGFRFLHVSSALPRKGVDVLLRAWARLSGGGGPEVSLVIKTTPNPHSRVRDDVAAFEKLHPSAGPIILIDEEVDEQTLKALYQVCDALVAPTRAEGFGLPMAEAVLAGKPVITTGWGGQLDFCTPETAWLVRWRFAEARSHLSTPGSLWVEPDVDDLVEQMRLVATAPHPEVTRKVEAGRALLRSHHRWDDVAARLTDAVASVRAAPLARLPSVCVVSTWGSRCGIAAYARSLSAAVPPGHLCVLANTDAELVEDDGPEVRRVWRSGLDDDLGELGAALAESDASTVVFQFNFGFFRLSRLGPLVERLVDEGRAVHLVLHSTADVERPDLRVSLRDAASSLTRATRLLVHSVDDLHRLQAFGLAANATLLPHGVPTLGQRPGTSARRAGLLPDLDGRQVVATFGYLLPGKGLQEVVSAMALLRRRAIAEGRPAPHLLMVNALYPGRESTQELDACQRIIREEGLSGAVTLITDYLPEWEAISILSLADVVAYAYQRTQESSSAAVRMGLASLRPVAVTPLPIFRDVASVTHSLPGRTPAEVAAGLQRLLHATSGPADAPDLAATSLRQAEWVAGHAWSHVADRFWGMVRALDLRTGAARRCTPASAGALAA